MPATNPLSDVSANGGAYSGVAYQGGLSSVQPGATNVSGSGNAHVAVGGLLLAAIAVVVLMHIAGFRFSSDVSLGQ